MSPPSVEELGVRGWRRNFHSFVLEAVSVLSSLYGFRGPLLLLVVSVFYLGNFFFFFAMLTNHHIEMQGVGY